MSASRNPVNIYGSCTPHTLALSRPSNQLMAKWTCNGFAVKVATPPASHTV